MFKKEELKFY